MAPTPAILVIDDDPTTCLHIARHLQKQGYDIAIAGNGCQGLEMAHSQPDLIILDILMPEMDGYQTLECLKANEQLKHIPVIMISAIDDLDGVVRCIQLGAEDYLLKPINSVLLDARVNASLEQKRLRDREQAYLKQLQTDKAGAEAANRAKSAFLANMSHELKTPLNAIIGYSEILIEEFQQEGYDGFVPDLQNIRDSGKHLLNLINDILDISKIEAGKMELHPETFDVCSLVQEVVNSLRLAIASNHNIVEVCLAPDLNLMCADLGRVRQILWNLLSNAAKFTERGKITITVNPSPAPVPISDLRPSVTPTAAGAGTLPGICFQVSDTGIGIAREQQLQIFRAFTQADESSKRRYGGTGLGLTICHRLCQLMGGHVTLESKVDSGSTFTVWLPRHPPTLTSARRNLSLPAGMEHLVSALASLVLVIAGDRTTRDRLVQYLNQSGLRVVTAWCGREGLRLAKELQPDLVILNLFLPEHDCWSTLFELKTDPSLTNTPVAVLAPPTSQPLVIQPAGFTLGIVEYLSQSDNFSPLLSRLEHYRQTTGGRLNHARILSVPDPSFNQTKLEQSLRESGWQVQTWNWFELEDESKFISESSITLLNLMILVEGRISPCLPIPGQSPLVSLITPNLLTCDTIRLNQLTEEWFSKSAHQGANQSANQGAVDEDDWVDDILSQLIPFLQVQIDQPTRIEMDV
jgi:signal transduction histidine kinase